MLLQIVFFLYVLWILNWIINWLYRKKEEEATANPFTIQYYVNGERLEESHASHYRKVMGLSSTTKLTTEIISAAHYQIHEEVRNRRLKYPVQINLREWRAAKAFLEDRCYYLGTNN
jgi:hypothetical protein